MERRWLSVNECADYLGLHRKTVYELIYSHSLPAGKIPGSRSWRIDKLKIDSQLEAQIKAKGQGLSG